MECYANLRPDAEYETCECAQLKGLLLVYMLTSNPVHCSECRKMVDPERLKLSGDLVDSIFAWQRVFGSLYGLWLDSGDYEIWAKERMLDPVGQVNKDGLALAKSLSGYFPTRYWWFHDTDDPMPSICPNCHSSLEQPTGRYGNSQCPHCPVLI